MKTVWNWHWDLKTASEANGVKKTVSEWRKKDGVLVKVKKQKSENRWDKAERHKFQKQKVKAVLLSERPPITIPCSVVICRIAPRELDEHDNLRISLKWVVDAIAEYLVPGKAVGRADDCKKITWEYKQEKGAVREYGISIQISCES